MGGYAPLKVTGMQTGLVQEREEFLLPEDAYPILENAYVWRERIKRKQGYELLGRLQRIMTGMLALDGSGNATLATIFNFLAASPNAQIAPGSITLTFGGTIITDANADGTLINAGLTVVGSVNYLTGAITIVSQAGNTANPAVFGYFPNLPVMGLRLQELSGIGNTQTIAFDTVYAYKWNGTTWQEFLPGFTWSSTDSNFFWTTNYWVSPAPANIKLFWATNNSGIFGNPSPGTDQIRYTDGQTVWVDFRPELNMTGAVTTRLQQCLCILPFRGTLLVANTLEGDPLSTSIAYPQRIRWSAIGQNPITDIDTVIFPNVNQVNPNAWRDDIPGKGGFLDVPTGEDIISIGFVRDNLVVFCERSTWQLRYTGRAIAPFIIEKINSELGIEGTFSNVQFDTALVGIGDKGVVSCDSFKSNRIDIKIPDLVYAFNNSTITDGVQRVYGIRDFVKRLAYWTYPFVPNDEASDIYPNRRLVYNYENDSWAIFTDSLTVLGTFQPTSPRTWADTEEPWERLNFSWANRPLLMPTIVGGNQQGFVEYLDQQTTNDVSLYIKSITGNTTTATNIESPDHNLETGQVISIEDINPGDSFANLNGMIFGVDVQDADNFLILLYDPASGLFDDPELDPPGTYTGAGQIKVRDNFDIVSKKFNFIDEGQNIQMGYLDILMDNSADGAISMNVYIDYADENPVNTYPGNQNQDPFFNTVIPTTGNSTDASKALNRVYCPVRGAFITIEYTLSNAQMNGDEQESDVQIDAQVLWIRKGGRLQSIGAST